MNFIDSMVLYVLWIAVGLLTGKVVNLSYRVRDLESRIHQNKDVK